MIRLDVNNWQELHDLIDPDDFTGSGFDSHPHITLVFGLDTLSNTKEIKAVLKESNLMGTKINLDKVSAFKNENDVLHYSISDPKMYSRLKMNHLRLSNAIDSKLTHRDFKPHVTVAFLKSGTVDKYLSKLPNLVGEVTNFWYSTTFKV